MSIVAQDYSIQQMYEDQIWNTPKLVTKQIDHAYCTLNKFNPNKTGVAVVAYILTRMNETGSLTVYLSNFEISKHVGKTSNTVNLNKKFCEQFFHKTLGMKMKTGYTLKEHVLLGSKDQNTDIKLYEHILTQARVDGLVGTRTQRVIMSKVALTDGPIDVVSLAIFLNSSVRSVQVMVKDLFHKGMLTRIKVGKTFFYTKSNTQWECNTSIVDTRDQKYKKTVQ